MADGSDIREEIWAKPCANCNTLLDTRTGIDDTVEVQVKVTVTERNERSELVFCDLACLREYFIEVGE